MVIRVQYDNGRFDMVKATRLDDLLPHGKLAAFQRMDGWVIVGKDLIRGTSQQTYIGSERRGTVSRVLPVHSLEKYFPGSG